MDIKEFENLRKSYLKIEPDKRWAKGVKFSILKEFDSETSNNYNIFNIFANNYFKSLSVAGSFLAVVVFLVVAGVVNNQSDKASYTINNDANNINTISGSENKIAALNENLLKLQQAVDKGDNVESVLEEVENVAEKISESPDEVAAVIQNNPEMISYIKEARIKKEILSAKGINHIIDDVDNALKEIVKAQIDDLELRKLPKDKMEILKEAVELYREGKYDMAMEKILFINNNY